MNKLPDDEDSRLGRLVRMLRLRSGVTQQELGLAVGVTSQQIQKYETGANSITSSRLAGLARALGVEPNSFFDEPFRNADSSFGDILVDKQNIRALLAFSRISDAKLKASFIQLLECVAETAS